ncbi:hypothetical protein MUK42_19061 [Musa troglodytarum]|uniref:Uncharacterized protein n=1 Tax=Musa troglodytarum TaxID=320322 RepID=A0A9E7ENW2_9LILI|nr:hypothetical protein MUK42_19061 [Musa troglodytarum]
MGRRRWTEFGSRSVNLYPRRLHPREREEKLEGRWVATSTWGAHHSDVVDVLDEGRREQRERRGGDNGCHGILLLDVNIILGAGDYCAWAAPPVCTQKVWAGRSSLTEVIESPRGEEGNAVKVFRYYEFVIVGVVGALFHFFLRSTTTTLTLSALCLAKASFVSSTAASEHVASPPPPSPSPATSSSSSPPPPPCRHILAMSQAVSLLTTSHSPSLARIRHSSPSSLSNTLTSGSGITYGFK